MRYIPLLFVTGFLGSSILLAGTPPDNVRSAIRYQKQLLAENPDNAEAYNDLGNLFLLAEDPDRAEAAYLTATDLDNQLTSAYFNLGLLQAQKGDLENATVSFHTVLELDPNSAWSHYQIGRIYELSGNTTKALSAYTRAFSLNPRLSFSDVNPQVLDSQLTTRALLGLDAGRASAQEAPRVYQDPYRIAKLLLPKLPSEETAPPTVDEGLGEASPLEDGAPSPESSESSEEQLAPNRVGRSLSSSDLDRGSRVGQADPPAVQSRRNTGRRPSAANRNRAADRNRATNRSGHVGGQHLSDSSAAPRSTGQVRTRAVPNR